jgi:predicted HD phosphohydrolase
MTAEEAKAFERDPLCAVSLRMRQWDELAKEMGVPVIDLAVLKEKALHLLGE